MRLTAIDGSKRGRCDHTNASVSATYNGSWSFSASASSGKGAGDGAEVTHSNTRVEAGQLVQLDSGGNTSLKGAVVAANTVKATVGGDLLIQSLQDTSVWREESSQVGGSASTSGGASASASRTKIDADYASVGEQSGIRAGDGGFRHASGRYGCEDFLWDFGHTASYGERGC